ncbi:sigma factor G inhibitor Gin [Clostridium akagii]|uniref:sigma factor G inhibitor Gin n=1 Tax=Clostridium akagii TaxID=91623 RepID=UPI00047B6C82|nr:sigma factor G inhibitor Gin [Clostridium akagii]
MKKQNCIICRKSLNDGIIVNSKCVCRRCEMRLLKLEIGSDFYEYYKQCIKKNILQIKAVEDRCQNYQL